MPTAVCLVRVEPADRLQAYLSGLSRVGYQVSDHVQHRPRPGDVLVIWNRTGNLDQLAANWEHAGATVLVTENGWIGQDRDGRQLYALCKSQHNGAGDWCIGAEDRWKRWGIEPEPWRTAGENVLLLPQRGIGSLRVRMPPNWEQRTRRRLRKESERKVVIRPHPGRVKLEPHASFVNVHAAVTWASGAAIKAIVAGIPVVYEMPEWIGGKAAVRGLENLENLFMGDRTQMLRRLSWAQWELGEIASGEAFRCLLG